MRLMEILFKNDRQTISLITLSIKISFLDHAAVHITIQLLNLLFTISDLSLNSTITSSFEDRFEILKIKSRLSM